MSLFPWVFQPIPGKHRIRAKHKNPWVVTLTLSLLLLIGLGWGQTAASQETTEGTIVAAGLGYQRGDLSTITVRVYDAVSGTVLSDDTFELHVKEEPSRPYPGQERIFAGGVGLGATDLSTFILRVYDAKSGAFQWEGQLNLSPSDGSGRGHQVSTLAPRRATVSKTRTLEHAMQQHPSFLLRALDSTTGGLVWEDEFSTNGLGSGQVDSIAHRLMASGGGSTDVPRVFDFRIRMPTAAGQGVLWEDQFAPEDMEADMNEMADDHARVLPAWPRLFERHLVPDVI